MYKTGKYRKYDSQKRIPLAIKGFVLILSLCIVVRITSALGADITLEKIIAHLENDHVVDAILEFEMGLPMNSGNSVSLMSQILDSSLIAGDSQAVLADIVPSISPSPSPSSSKKEESITSTTESSSDASSPSTTTPSSASPDSQPQIITEKVPSSTNIKINNKTNYCIDTDALLKEPLNISLSNKEPVVLIIHTHGSEAYMPDSNNKYSESDPYRTEDPNYNVMRVGDELVGVFEKKGINVIHDKGLYDYPSYNGCYERSYAAIKNYLKKYPSIKIVLDIHRDAIEAADGSVFKTIAQIGNNSCSQVMILVGTNAVGLKNPHWQENLKLALHLQQSMNQLYPSLAIPIELSQYRYNMHATAGSLLVEIGCTGNTLPESLIAANYFADAASMVLLDLYK